MPNDEHTPNPGPSLWIGGGVLAGIGSASLAAIARLPEGGWDVFITTLMVGLGLLALVFVCVGVAGLRRARR